jgi:hypothetical protein
MERGDLIIYLTFFFLIGAGFGYYIARLIFG